MGRVSPEEFERLELRVHSFLAGVPLHDVWTVDLSGGGSDRTLGDLREIFSLERLTGTNRAVAFLFRLRRWLGGAFGWDRQQRDASASSFLHRLMAADREASLVVPGTPEGPFRVLYALPRETLSEIQNATVHAFSAFALVERSGGHRLYWAIYVLPVGPLTRWYMRLIDPFRRLVIYPAVLRNVRRAWDEAERRS